MPNTKFTCPHCSTTLKSDRPDLIGRKIKCQKCGQKFVAAAEHVRSKDGNRTVPVATGVAPPPSSATVELPAVTGELPAVHQTNIQTPAPRKTRNSQTSDASGSPKTRNTGAPVAAPFAPPRAARSPNSLLPVLLAALLVLLLGGGLAAYMIIASDPSETTQQQAQSETSSGSSPEPSLDVVPDDGLDSGPAESPETVAQESKKAKKEPDKKGTPTPAKAEPTPKKTEPKADGAKTPAKEKKKGKPGKLPSKLGKAPELGPKKTKTNKNKDDAYRTTLTAANQKKVNNAIDMGVQFLKSQQQADGGWGHKGYKVGYAALPALTLLECGVAKDDPAVQNAAEFVRKHSYGLNHTYQLSLAILFLDKLGEKKDHNLIRKLAMRLIAGQTYDGGWSYRCPILDNRERYELVTYLHETRPKPLIPTGKDGESLLIPVNNSESGEEIVPLSYENRNDDEPGRKGDQPLETKKNSIALPFPKGKGETSSGKKKGSDAETSPSSPPEEPAININQLSPGVRSLPIIQQQTIPKFLGRKNPFVIRKKGRSDNSNTQFAIMALWAARRCNVPIEKTMALVDQRFRSSQNQDGGWGYRYIHTSRPSMTCVGLIGLGAAHGSFMETLGKTWKNKKFKMTKEDPAIQMGLEAMSRNVGQSPKVWKKRIPMVNLYFLWSVERVAMLYNLRTVGKKDWYNWAAHMLVTNQKPNGSWSPGRYHGSHPVLDTSLSLLILRRANLVQDLTQNLKDFVPITDPGQQ